LGGQVSGVNGESIVVYYDEDWRVSGEDGAFYVMSLCRINDEPQYIRELSVEKATGEEILSFTVAARGK